MVVSSLKGVKAIATITTSHAHSNMPKGLQDLSMYEGENDKSIFSDFGECLVQYVAKVGGKGM